MAPGKRKRPERGDSTDNTGRPSPHRPQNLPSARNPHLVQQQDSHARGGGRRGSRTSGRGGASAPTSPSVAQPSPSAMSPPATVPPSGKPQAATPQPTSSTPAPPVNQQLTHPTAQATNQPNTPKVSPMNQYVTQQRAAAWSQGRTAVVQEGTQAQTTGDMLTVALLFDELVQACLDQAMAPKELGTTVRDILAAPATNMDVDPVSLFLDTVSTLTESITDYTPLKPMLEATEIDPTRMRSELESPLLVALDLVRSTFPRVAIRKATHALYRQSNYNLLREEAEGYSKLITEYFTTVSNEPPTEEVVTELFQRVKALIGAFDLDVGRVLDVTLDVHANLLVKHNRFFVKLLRVSSWWPEQKAPHGIEWEEPEVSTLPHWAVPGCSSWFYTDEEKEEQLRIREHRDLGFWKRVDKVGIKAYFELGARKITSGMSLLEDADDVTMGEHTESSEKKPAEPSDFEKIQKWSQEWMKATGTLPPSGNRIAAQLLGFKLRFYASDARDAHDNLPDNLIYLAALLIKIGFISLADLYPHLYPLDEDMPAHRDKLMKAKKENDDKLRGVANNALAMAAALPDDTAPPAPVARLRETESKSSSKPESERGTPPRTDEEAKSKLPEPVDQKVALLRSLLCIGAIPEALFILSRFPWLLDVYPDIHNYLFRLAHHSLSKVYSWARPHSQEEVPTVAKKGPTIGGNSLRATDFAPRRTLRWAKLEEKDAGDGIDYRFYWDDWADNVPICQNVDDVFKLSNTLLKFVGLECGKDGVLLTKLVRIGKKSLVEDGSQSNMRRWINFSATFIGPALTFSGRNPGVVNEAWELFKHFDTATRYSIYSTWFTGSAKRQLAVQGKFAEITTEVKRLFNRINTENTRAMGRAIAKPAYACPGVVFERALKTAETYPNMIDPMVECCRYLTFLGYDCLNWTFINSFKEERSGVQGDGMLTKHWLKNAALFVGKAYRRYSLMDPTPILQFVADQLLRGKLFMLEILEQLVSSMAGIGPVLALTESQVHGLSAGPLLRAFTLEHYLGDKRHQAKVTGKRFLKCLKEAGLGAQILVALAIELEKYVYRPEFEEADTPLKVVSTNLDNLHSNFAQYLDFLRSFLPIEEFDTMIPGVVELMAEFGVGPGIAFTICRASLSIHVNAARAEKRSNSDTLKVETPTPDGGQANNDIPMGGVDETPVVNGVTTATDNTEKKESVEDSEMKDAAPTTDIEMQDSPDAEKPAPNGVNASPATHQGRSNTVITALADRLKTEMPEIYGSHICPEFFVSFWQLSLVDVFTVTSMKEMKEYTAASRFYGEKANRVPYDRRDVSAQSVEKRRAEIQGYNDQSAALRQEAKDNLEAALKMRGYLQEEMHHWFDGIPMVDARSEELHDAILQDCFLPRILLSSQDAQYASAMLKFMHEIGVPGFRTMKLLDQLFKQKVLTGVIFMCTAREAQNLGRFLNDVLKELSAWHSSQANYTKFAQGPRKSLPGFGRTFNPDRTPATFLDYEDFRRVLFKWHTQLFRALETCLKADEYMHIRNAINVLKATATSFPKVDTMGKSLHQLVQNLSQNDSRDDLKLAALSLLGDLKKNEKFLVTPQAFHPTRNAPVPAGAPNATSRTSSEQPRTPQPPEPSNARLNATAPEFNPRPTTANGTSRSTPTINNGPDGNISDERRRSGTTAAGAEPRSHDRAPNRPNPALSESRSIAPSQRNEDATTRGPQQDTRSAAASAALPTPPVSRLDARGTAGNPTGAGRTPHTLPPRPDAQPPRPRQQERGADRQSDYNNPGRNDARSNAAPSYGRLDRPGDNQRDSFQDRRDLSPGRPPRGRTPERRDPSWGGRDLRDGRDPRDYPDERSMRPPPRDSRGGPPPYHPRESRDPRDLRDPRDMRDPRDRGDPRGPPPPSPVDGGPYRRDYPPRQSTDRPSTSAPSPALDRQAPGDGPRLNPERAALIGEDRGRNDVPRSERDSRHERGSRPQSPRRGYERPPSSYQGRNEGGRDHREDRNHERPTHDRTPPHNIPPSRDRREDMTGVPPTGPRGGRGDPSGPGRVSRDMFMPAHPGSRPTTHSTQDPNYGRLNPPTDNIPSGPRGLASDRRDSSRRESVEQSHPPVPPAPHGAPAAPQSSRANVHPSRLQIINNAPPLQTDVVNAPSGPRSSARTPVGPAASSPSNTRGPPTGPAATDRNGRNQDRNALRAINSVLSQSQNQPSGDPSDQAPPIRGRGGARTLVNPPNVSSPAASSSHPNTPNPSRPEGPQSRADHASNRNDGRVQDDGRVDSRGHRDGRRSERSGRGRSRSPERADRRGEERSTRNGRSDDQERPTDRDRGSGRDKRGSDRDGNRRERDRERDGDRSARDRDRRERGGREDGRGAGRGEEVGSRRGALPVSSDPSVFPGEGRGETRSGDTRTRGREDRSDRRRDEQREGRGDSRKRGPPEEPPAHRDSKRRR